MFGGDSNARFRHQVGEITRPSHVAALTNQFFQQALGSPAYSQALGTIAAGANQAGNNVARNLGQAGIFGSGTGAVLSGLTPSLVGSQRAGLTSSAYSAAQSQAQSQIEQALKALYATSGPSYSGQLGAAGLSAFGPVLQEWFKHYLAGRGLNTAGSSTPQWNYAAGGL